jgi:hypothetical protein
MAGDKDLLGNSVFMARQRNKTVAGRQRRLSNRKTDTKRASRSAAVTRIESLTRTVDATGTEHGYRSDSAAGQRVHHNYATFADQVAFCIWGRRREQVDAIETSADLEQQ